MPAPTTQEDIAELSQLWVEYQRATVFVLEIIRTDGANVATFPKIRAQHEKASRAIELMSTFYGLLSLRK
jgi:hypothetical protein